MTIPVTTDPRGGASSADYSGVPRSVTFAAGETEQTFTVTATEDTVDDDGESLQLGFGALPAGVLLGSPSTATVALVQDADVSTWYVWFGEFSYTVTEGGSATISVHLNSPWKPELNEALTVPLFDPEHRGGATADDYSGLPESVTFQPGQTRASFTVRVTEDSEDDDGESVEIGFRRLFPEDLEVGRYGPHKTTLHIADNDGEKAVTVSFEAANYTAVEGGAAATVRVVLDAAPGRTVTIPLTATTTNRGATAADYSGVPASVTFSASETVKSFSLTATDDAVDDDLESVVLGFDALPPRVRAVKPSQAVVNLNDNDGERGLLTVNFGTSAAMPPSNVREGGLFWMSFFLNVGDKPAYDLTLPLTYEYLYGASAADFADLPPSVTFEAGKRRAGVTLRIARDYEADPGEGVRASFGTLPAGVEVGEWSGPTKEFRIIDEDGFPGLTVADASAKEWTPEPCLIFDVKLDRAVDHEVSVDYATRDGTAVAGQDFRPVSGTLVFREGERLKRVCVKVIDDSHDEGLEDMKLELSDPVRAYLFDGIATGWINNSGAIPQAWLARFGRTVADQVLGAVDERLRVAREGGVSVSLGGVRVGGAAAKADAQGTARWRRGRTGRAQRRRRTSVRAAGRRMRRDGGCEGGCARGWRRGRLANAETAQDERARGGGCGGCAGAAGGWSHGERRDEDERARGGPADAQGRRMRRRMRGAAGGVVAPAERRDGAGRACARRAGGCARDGGCEGGCAGAAGGVVAPWSAERRDGAGRACAWRAGGCARDGAAGGVVALAERRDGAGRACARQDPDADRARAPDGVVVLAGGGGGRRRLYRDLGPDGAVALLGARGCAEPGRRGDHGPCGRGPCVRSLDDGSGGVAQHRRGGLPG